MSTEVERRNTREGAREEKKEQDDGIRNGNESQII